MWAQPGKKLLFMGGELGVWREWNHDAELDWGLLGAPPHAGIQKWVRDLNGLYARERALHELDFEPAGFSWIDCADFERSVVSLLRRGAAEDDAVAAVFNFTPVPRYGYRVGVPRPGIWKEIGNSDAEEYGGSGVENLGGCEAAEVPAHGHPASMEVTIPPLGAVFFKQPAIPLQPRPSPRKRAAGKPKGERRKP
jgi:1,4-alpha-glucan branching enzyme